MSSGENTNRGGINWFPGHMARALREIEADLRNVDVVIYVLDARAPLACINPSLDACLGAKPVIYLINKADLGAGVVLEGVLGKLSTRSDACLCVNAKSPNAAKIITEAVNNLCKNKIEKYKRKGVNATVRGMVVGVPNCGKSTIINAVCGKSKAAAGNKPGVTRGRQWVRIGEYFELLDTPGTLYPKLGDEVAARRLAFIGCIKDEVTDSEELALLLIDELNKIDPDILKKRYGIEDGAEGILEKIADKRGFKARGGEPDVLRAAKTLIDDLRKGRLGQITFD